MRNTTEMITVSMRELNRLKNIQAIIDRNMTTSIAAGRLGLSDRQVRRLVDRYRKEGAIGLISKQRGKASNRKLPEGLEAKTVKIIRDNYYDFGPTLACEKLADIHEIHLPVETVRRIMMRSGIWITRKMRPPKIHQPRYRRACLGELIQIDGSDHHWFEDRAPACTLLVYVDDGRK